MNIMENTEIKSAHIAIVENEAAYRKSIIEKLKHLPEIASVDEFSSAEDFWLNTEKDKFDIIFLDIAMPGMNGLELVSMIKAKRLKARILMLTNLTSEDTIVNAIKRGAIGYLWKSDLNDIGEIVEVTLNGGAMISPNIALKLIQSFKRPAETPTEELSTRERQVLELLISGINCEKVADTMHISIHTVRTHVRNMYEKLHVNNRAALVKKAREMGLG